MSKFFTLKEAENAGAFIDQNAWEAYSEKMKRLGKFPSPLSAQKAEALFDVDDEKLVA